MKKRLLSTFIIFFTILLFMGIQAAHAKGLKGTVQLKGEHGPCEIINTIKKVQTNGPCSPEEEKRKVIVVVGDEPCQEAGVTTVLRFKGERPFKVVGKVKRLGKGLSDKDLLKGVSPDSEIIIWLGDKGGAYILIKPKRSVLKKVDIGERVILKTKAKRMAIEGC